MGKLTALKPELVWDFFEQICSIPRPSGKEEQIVAFLMNFARLNNLSSKQDAAGNVLITKPGCKGRETDRTIVLQSHLDMVCEKNQESVHDFDQDPIIAFVDGDWVTAEGTTLGADCGIGIAAQLALLSSVSLDHGPIECLFTVDEERGLTGAKAIEPGFFSGRTLLNLDSEDEGELFIGCAGGMDTVIEINYYPEATPAGLFPIQISVKGLQGGHSGDDIHKNRGNAIKLLVRFLRQQAEKTSIRLATLSGGNLRNAIPREATATILVPMSYREQITIDFNLFRAAMEQEIGIDEPAMVLSLQSTEQPENVFDMDTQFKLIQALQACPHGVLRMSSRMPGMVETSTNLAAVKAIASNRLKITTSQRSDIPTGLADAASMVASVFQLIGADIHHGEGYPGWLPNRDSEILTITHEAYSNCFGVEPLVRSIHAGLECGLLLEKFPGLDMISFGPTLRGVHSPDERIEIASVAKFWTLLLEVLKNYH